MACGHRVTSVVHIPPDHHRWPPSSAGSAVPEPPLTSKVTISGWSIRQARLWRGQRRRRRCRAGCWPESLAAWGTSSRRSPGRSSVPNGDGGCFFDPAVHGASPSVCGVPGASWAVQVLGVRVGLAVASSANSAVRSVDDERTDGAGRRSPLGEPSTGRADAAPWQRPAPIGQPGELRGLDGLFDDVAAVRDPVAAAALDAGLREPEPRFGRPALPGPVHEGLVHPDLWGDVGNCPVGADDA